MLQDAVESFIASLSVKEYENGGNHRNTIMAYRNDLRQLSAYLEQQGLEEWSQISQEHVLGYLVEMRDTQAYRPTTIARKLAALKSFFRYIHNSGMIASDPVEKLKSPHIEKDLPQVLSVEQVEQLFALVENTTPGGQRDFAMLHVLYSTGMRASEIVSLNMADCEIARARVLCPVHSGQLKRERVLPLSSLAIEAMQRYLTDGRPRLARRTGESALFLNHHGERLTRQGFWLIIKGYARQAGITDLTPHMLRHSFAFLMLQEGKELRFVQELLGHAHISTTQVYRHLALATVAHK
ncbi:tyrosine recombinase [Ktedonosporobacter rubrisoli]|nr:tyrosine recombinase [Ktedonosporobacter rubrisoli]